VVEVFYITELVVISIKIITFTVFSSKYQVIVNIATKVIIIIIIFKITMNVVIIFIMLTYCVSVSVIKIIIICTQITIHIIIHFNFMIIT